MRKNLLPGSFCFCLLVSLSLLLTDAWPARANEAPPAPADSDNDLAASGIFLPNDRLRERQYEQARRLISAGRMADAATLLDELLGAEDDFFLDGDRVKGATCQSIKTRVNEVVRDLSPDGQDAYQLQFRTRAERALTAAISTDNHEAIINVARRWFHTAAGQRAALLTAVTLLESGQPLAAAAWLDRITAKPVAALPPDVAATIRLMRAVAHASTAIEAHHFKDLIKALADLPKTTRLGAATLPLGGSVGEQILATQLIEAVQGGTEKRNREAADWPLARGRPDRNPTCTADRPLLVPRYRVPLTLHPEEERLLQQRRQLFSEQGIPILPAGMPLAIGNIILVQSRAGLVAIDFETGKRVWLRGRLSPSALADDSDDDQRSEVEKTHPLDPFFFDTNSATLASDGEHVFAIESPLRLGRRANLMRGPADMTNRLAAYGLSDGRLCWELPRKPETLKPRWYLGSPLPLGDELYVLVEEQQQISLEALAADTGERLWSQPLAEVDLEHDITNCQERRWAGLSPAFAEGILICPTGAGGTIAVDLTSRTLRWAYRFPIPNPPDIRQMRNGMQVGMRIFARGVDGQFVIQNSDQAMASGWLDSLPTIAGNFALLTPLDSDQLHCLDLHTGEVRWRVRRGEMLSLAGVIDRKVILLGQRGVTAVSLDDGQPCWPGIPAHGGQFANNRSCGRGLLTENRFYVPITSPGLIAIDLATGRVIDTSPSRDERLPGNLVAYRGEVISQGLGSLDVYHQTAPLKQAIETAMANDTDDPWAIGWRGELRLAAGDTVIGLNDIRRMFGPAGQRPAPSILSRGIRFALRNDFAAAAAYWQEGMALAETPPQAATIRQLASAGFFNANELASAWLVCRSALTANTPPPFSERLVPDREDDHLMLADKRWFQRQVHRLLPDVGESIRPVPATLLEQINNDARDALAAAQSPETPATRRKALTQVIERFGSHSVALEARDMLMATLRVAGENMTGKPLQNILLELDLLTLEQAAPSVSQASSLSSQQARSEIDTAWPVGRVEAQMRNELTANSDILPATAQPVTLIHDEQSAYPQAILETAGDRFVLRDRFGRPIGSSMALPSSNSSSRQLFNRNPGATAYLLGRVLLLQHNTSLTAYEICPPTFGENRFLWTMDHPFLDGTFRHSIGMRTEPNRGFRALGSLPLGGAPQQNSPITRVPDFRLGRPRVTGVPVIYKQTLELRDLRTGTVLWRRQKIPPFAEAFGDNDVLCVTTPDGKDSLVLAMSDGRLLAKRQLPSRQRRLTAAGRQLLIIAKTDNESAKKTNNLRLATLDVLTDKATVVGDCSKHAVATLAHYGVFMTMDPSGQLTAIDIPASQIIFNTKLPEMAGQLKHFKCLPWQDRYLIFASRTETFRDNRRFEAVEKIEAFTSRGLGAAPESGSLWAVDRLTGDQLWTGPASIERHLLHVPQPTGLPVLVFARRMHLTRTSRLAGQPRHSLLCLDKRTGAEVHCDDKILFEDRHAARLTSLDIVADPFRSTIGLRIRMGHQIGGKTPEVSLHFTGEPTATKTPFRAEDYPLVYTDLSTELKYWIESGIEGIENVLEFLP